MKSEELLNLLKTHFEPLGLEAYLFKISWYNDLVVPSFKFKGDNDTICAVIISIPSFFEKAFLPYFKKQDSKTFERDPIDSCVKFQVQAFINKLDNMNVSAMFDYELLPNRRPKVLVQTAAHASGAAFYYQRKHVTMSTSNSNSSSRTQKSATHTEKSDPEKVLGSGDQDTDPWSEEEKIFGLCVHPKYGGWFAIRCVMIFHDVKDPSLQHNPPPDCVPSRDGRIKVLNLFNGNWKDWKYRDIIPVEEKYSELQKLYFETLPKNRLKVLGEKLKNA